MNISAILSRCQQNAEEWEGQSKNLSFPANYMTAAKFAAADWRSLEKEIGEELDRENNNNQQGEDHANK